MSGMLALLPFAITTCAIKDFCCLCIILYVREREETGAAIERKTQSCLETSARMTKKTWLCCYSPPLPFSSESGWLINNSSGVCGGLVNRARPCQVELWWLLLCVTADLRVCGCACVRGCACVWEREWRGPCQTWFTKTQCSCAFTKSRHRHNQWSISLCVCLSVQQIG